MFLVWNWGAAIESVSFADDTLLVRRADGSVHRHRPHGEAWRVTMVPAGASRPAGAEASAVRTAGTCLPSGAGSPDVVELGVGRAADIRARQRAGARDADETAGSARRGQRSSPGGLDPFVLASGEALEFELGREEYRISEETWEEAGCPMAIVVIRVEPGTLLIEVDVRKSPLAFRGRDAADPALDNEPPDIHSDGVQLYVHDAAWSSPAGWLVVPEPGGVVRTAPVGGSRTDLPLEAGWRPTHDGYAMRFAIPTDTLSGSAPHSLGVEVVVNDMSPGRTRRRGQLVLSGGGGGGGGEGGGRNYVYLRGDRERADNFRRFIIPSV